jgi:hypothetical protein
MGDKMEAKGLDPKYLELLAEEEYEQFKNCLVRVQALNGYADNVASDTFYPDMFEKPVIVRIQKADKERDLHHWMDEWLDPIYPVEIVERGDLPEGLRSCWIYGICRSLDGRFESGDIYAVVSDLKVRHTGQLIEKINIQDIAKRMGAKICDPPAKFRHLMGFMRPRSTCGPSKETKTWVEKRKREISGEAVEVYDQLADRKAVAEKSIIDAENRDTFEALDQKTYKELQTTNELLTRFSKVIWKHLVAAHGLASEAEKDFFLARLLDSDDLNLVGLEAEFLHWLSKWRRM